METIEALPATPYRRDEPMTAAAAVASLAALAQPTRLAIFRRLVEFAPDGLTPGAIAQALDLPGPTLSFHLKELVNAGLVGDQREGRHIRYRADVGAMNALMGYLTDHCCRGVGRLVDSAACMPACAPGACDTDPDAPSRR